MKSILSSMLNAVMAFLKSKSASASASTSAPVATPAVPTSVSPKAPRPVSAPRIPNTRPIPPIVAKRGWSKDINDCRDELIRALPIVKARWEALHPGWTIKCDYTYRSPAFQFTLYKKGRHPVGNEWVENDPVHHTGIVTFDSGIHPSHHNVWPSQAADVYIVDPRGNFVWNDPVMYRELGSLWDSQGLVSGALWKYEWKDWGHVQVSYELL